MRPSISDPSYDQVSSSSLRFYLLLTDTQHFSVVMLGIGLILVKVGNIVQ
jgi:hypothetical protein